MHASATTTQHAARLSTGAELADLLRARRESLKPEDVGLPPGRRRRTRGLRREEVALLAAISPTYYAYLEQARELHPSREVLDALARALRLGGAERVHIHELVHGTPPPRSGVAAAELPAPGLAELVARLDPYPTYVKDHRWEVLLANRSARVLFRDWSSAPGKPRNMLRWMLLDPLARDVYPQWQMEAEAMVARFRMAAARRPSDGDTLALIDSLHAEAPGFAELWARHGVLAQGSGHKQLAHPVIGTVTFEHVVLRPEELDQTLVTFSPPRGESVQLDALAALCR